MSEKEIPISKKHAKSRDIRLDIIRSISMLYIVFIWHFCDYVSLINPEKIVILTKCVLTSFFLISGYLFGRHSHFQTGKDILVFYKKRVLRIVPLFALALVAFYLCGLVSFTDAIKTLLGISAFSLPHTKTLWFMNVIITFYLITPFLLYKDKKTFFFVFAGLSCLSFIVLYALKIKVDIRLLLYFPAYCVGLFWHHFKTDLFISEKKLRYFVACIAFVLFAAMYCFILWKKHNTYSEITLPLLFFIAFEAITWNVFFTQGCMVLSRFSTIFSFLSYSSFSVYLFHRPFLELLKSSLTRNNISADSWISIGSFFVSIPLIIIISWFIQKMFDRIVQKISG